ncbi:30S ribosomal protein S20 [Buchnera aphidicola (Eriosoma grossulariae)]|uniref:30S ribosomal protein S20 n=1 Tax=Buchnera aphidicola TaxID=9 RepID=UPI003463EC5B
MANIKSSKRDATLSKKKNIHNVSRRSMIRTLIKRVYMAIDSGDKNQSEIAFKKMQPELDRQANKGLIHKNKSARHKSNLILQIKKLS